MLSCFALLLAALWGGSCRATFPWQRKARKAWNYGNQTLWADLPGSMCGHLGDQSPIDVRIAQTLAAGTFPLRRSAGHNDSLSFQMGPVTWSYSLPRVNVSLGWTERHGWRVRLLPPYNATTVVTFYGKNFVLKEVRYFSPSENRLEGSSFDMEAQHIHEAVDGQILITSVFLAVRLVPNNAYLAQFWDGFPPFGKAESHRIVTNPFYGAFPRDRSFVAFNGSLTHPPCSNETVWVVFREPVLISREQRDLFRTSMNETAKSFLRYTPQAHPPAGVIEPWDTSIGMNNRLTQQQGFREVVGFDMLPGSADAAYHSQSASSFGGNGGAKVRGTAAALSDFSWRKTEDLIEHANTKHLWAYTVLSLVGIVVLAGVVALAVMARQHERLWRKTRVYTEREELLDHDRGGSARSRASRSRSPLRSPQSRDLGPPADRNTMFAASPQLQWQQRPDSMQQSPQRRPFTAVAMHAVAQMVPVVSHAPLPPGTTVLRPANNNSFVPAAALGTAMKSAAVPHLVATNPQTGSWVAPPQHLPTSGSVIVR